MLGPGAMRAGTGGSAGPDPGTGGRRVPDPAGGTAAAVDALLAEYLHTRLGRPGGWTPCSRRRWRPGSPRSSCAEASGSGRLSSGADGWRREDPATPGHRCVSVPHSNCCRPARWSTTTSWTNRRCAGAHRPCTRSSRVCTGKAVCTAPPPATPARRRSWPETSPWCGPTTCSPRPRLVPRTADSCTGSGRRCAARWSQGSTWTCGPRRPVPPTRPRPGTSRRSRARSTPWSGRSPWARPWPGPMPAAWTRCVPPDGAPDSPSSSTTTCWEHSGTPPSRASPRTRT